jgi:hypothetical protein
VLRKPLKPKFDDPRWKRDVQRATVSDVANTSEQ